MRQWSIQTKSLQKNFGVIHDDAITQIAMVPNENSVLTLSLDRRLKKWGINENGINPAYDYDYGIIDIICFTYSFVISQQLNCIYCVGDDRKIKQYSLAVQDNQRKCFFDIKKDENARLLYEYDNAHEKSIK